MSYIARTGCQYARHRKAAISTSTTTNNFILLVAYCCILHLAPVFLFYTRLVCMNNQQHEQYVMYTKINNDNILIKALLKNFNVIFLARHSIVRNLIIYNFDTNTLNPRIIVFAVCII